MSSPPPPPTPHLQTLRQHRHPKIQTQPVSHLTATRTVTTTSSRSANLELVNVIHNVVTVSEDDEESVNHHHHHVTATDVIDEDFYF